MTQSAGIADKSWSVLSRDVVVLVLRVVSSALVARELGPAAMGVWIVLQMIPSYAEAIARPKTDVASVYLLGRGSYRIGELSFVLNVISVATSIVLILLVAWYADVIRDSLIKQPEGRLIHIVLMSFSIPIQFVYLNYAYFLLHYENVQGYNRMLLIREIGGFALTLLLLLGFGLGIIGMVLLTLLAGVASVVYGAIVVHAIEPMEVRWRPGIIRALLGYSVPLYVSGLFSHLNLYAISSLVAFYLTPLQVAFYRMGQDNAFLLNRLPSAVGTILYPRVSKIGPDAAVLAARACRIVLLMLMLAGLVGLILIKPTVVLLYGAEYVAMITSFRILIPGVVLSGATGMLCQYFLGVGRPRLTTALSFAQLVVQIGAATYLVPLHGVVGAAATSSISLIALGCLTAVLFSRTTGLSVRMTLLPTMTDVRDIVAFGLGRMKRVRMAVA